MAAQPHGRRLVRVRDLPSSGRPVTLLWLKRLCRCPEPACSVRTWSETAEAFRTRASLTERARREACRLVGEDGLDVTAVATMLGVGWHTVMRAAGLRPAADRRPGPHRQGGHGRRRRDRVPGGERRLTHAVRHRDRGDAGPRPGAGAAARRRPRPHGKRCVAVDQRTGPVAGGPVSRPPHSTRSAATPPPYVPAFPTRCGCWTPFTSSASDRPPLTTSDVADSRRPSADGAIVRTRSTAAGACCVAAS